MEQNMNYQWYPGHMTKARRMMEENIKLIDLVIELVDARIPLAAEIPILTGLQKIRHVSFYSINPIYPMNAKM